MEAAAARKEWRAVPDAPLHSNGAECVGSRGAWEDGVIRGQSHVRGRGRTTRRLLLDHHRRKRGAQRGHHPAVPAERRAPAEELQRLEMELRAQEQLHEREKYILELEMKLDDKDRELDALKIDHQTVWANQYLLREQMKELATFRRERDNSEAGGSARTSSSSAGRAPCISGRSFSGLRWSCELRSSPTRRSLRCSAASRLLPRSMWQLLAIVAFTFLDH